MTRENKLALVIGFGLILFVGVLVSDHFSAANNDLAADFTANEELLIAPSYSPPKLVALETAPIEPPQSSPVAQVEDQQPVVPETPTVDSSASLDGSFEVVQAPDLQQIERASLEDLARKFADVPHASHQVGKGETLYAICKRFYGDGGLADELARFNDMANPAAVSEGRRLRLPAAEVLRGGAPAPALTQAQIQPATTTTTVRSLTGFDRQTPAAQAPKAATAAYTTYTIKSNDTLYKIAGRLLGSPSRMQELIDLNPGVLNNPRKLKVGATIKVPRSLASGS
jgi:nucleoid-associated protein YgaU